MTPDTIAAPVTPVSKPKIRPFPWLCPKCTQEEVYMASVPYRAEGRQNGQVVAVTIPALKIPMCANCGELLFTDKADEQIRIALDAVGQNFGSERRPSPAGSSSTAHGALTFTAEESQIQFAKETAQAMLQRLDATRSWDPSDYLDIHPHADLFLRMMRWANREDISAN